MKVGFDSSASAMMNALRMPRSPQSSAAHKLGPQGSWSDIAHKVSELMNTAPNPTLPLAERMKDLTGLFKLQMEVGQYQLKVELLSKVSESAVASMRKLQQNQ